MYLAQTKKGKVLRHKLVADQELAQGKSQNRGLTVLRAGNWSIEKQRELADQYGLCKTEHTVYREGEAVGSRVCGQYIRPRKDGYQRTTCGECANREFFQVDPLGKEAVNMYAPKGRQILFEGEGSSSAPHTCVLDLQSVSELLAKLQEQKNTIDTLTVKLEDRVQFGCHLMQELEDTKEKLADALARLEKGPMLQDCILTVWAIEGAEKNYSKRSQTMAKCTLKTFARALGLTLKSRREELFELAGTPAHAWKLMQELPDTVNIAKNLRMFYRYYNRGLWAQQLTKLQNETNKKEDATEEQALVLARRKTVEAMAISMSVSLAGEQPGRRLLKAIQSKLMVFEAHDSLTRKWLVHQLLGFFLPAARGLVDMFKWTQASPPQNEEQYQECKQNLITVRDGKVHALYFGALKKTDSDFVAHLWRLKRFWICEQGLQCCDGTFVLDHIDYGSFWAKLTSVLNAEYEEKHPRSNSKACFLKKGDMHKMNEAFFGTTLGSRIQRIVFRNGYPRKMNELFMGKVMQHSEAVDRHSYIKTCLMDGPWN